MAVNALFCDCGLSSLRRLRVPRAYADPCDPGVLLGVFSLALDVLLGVLASDALLRVLDGDCQSQIIKSNVIMCASWAGLPIFNLTPFENG